MAERRIIDTSNPGYANDIWRSLYLYNLYRILLAAAAVLVWLFPLTSFGSSNPHLFGVTALVYLSLSIASLISIHRRWVGSATLAFLTILSDLLVLTLFIATSGGIAGGLALLMVIPIAASGVLLSGRTALFSASIAVGLVLLQQAVLRWYANDEDGSFLHVGLLGLGLFATSLIVSWLASRAYQSEKLAKLREADVADLANINEMVIQQMPSGALIIDEDGQIRFANATAQVLLMTDDDEIGGRRLAEVSPALKRLENVWRKNHDVVDASFSEHASQKVLQARFHSLGENSALGTLIFIDEVGEARRREQQAKLAALGRLSGSIAHEIRNPLGAISHAAQLLRLVDAEKRGRLLDIIDKHSQRINRIIEDVMAVNRRDNLQPEQFDFGAWVTRFSREFCESHQLGDAAIRVDCAPKQLVFDPGHLRQIFQNLFDNALLHGDRAHPPLIWLRCSDLKGGYSVDIFDNGPGVPKEFQDRIFEPFFTKREDGVGLGLYISRELCEANGAMLEYRRESEGDRGCFWLTFKNNG